MSSSIEERLTALEREMVQLKQELQENDTKWWEVIYGRFSDDPIYSQAMRLGRQYSAKDRRKGRTG